MELVIKDVDGKATLCKPEKTVEIVERDWELVEEFLKQNKELWEKFFKDNY
jgi:hypothetical protein